MDLAPEDSLRLNVLLAQSLQAIRIDESSMTLYGLAASGEAKVKLAPNCRDDLYLRRVRELISGQVLGSPGGYPVFLRRWTRMGQISGVRLEDLLKLGESEAVVAVACAPDLSDELARRAWWAYPDPEVARRMLIHPAVVQGQMGKVLAEFLVEFLPFEEDPTLVMETVRLLLQPGLISAEQRQLLWNRGKRKNAYQVGFLDSLPDQLPEQVPARADSAGYALALGPLAEAGNPFARCLLRVLSAPGQTFLETAEAVLRRPPNQEVVLGLFAAIAKYFRAVAPPGDPPVSVGQCVAQADRLLAAAAAGGAEPSLGEALAAAPTLRAELRAALVLAQLGEPVLRPIFARTDAIGSLMRRKLEPLVAPLLDQCLVLRGRA